MVKRGIGGGIRSATKADAATKAGDVTPAAGAGLQPAGAGGQRTAAAGGQAAKTAGAAGSGDTAPASRRQRSSVRASEAATPAQAAIAPAAQAAKAAPPVPGARRSGRGLSAAGPRASAGQATGPLVVVWSPAGDSAGELLWQIGLCLASRKHAAILADLDLYTPGLAVAAGLLTPGTAPASVLDACLSQQAPALAAGVAPIADGRPARRPAPRLLSPDGQPLLQVLPGLIDLRGVDMLVPAQFDALAAWLQSQSGWRVVAVSAAVDCAGTVAFLAAADRLVLHVPQHSGRGALFTQLWLARAVHLLNSLPGVQARAELWLPGWEAAAAKEVAEHLQCPAHVLPAGGRRRSDALATLLGLKKVPAATMARGEIVAVR